MKKIILVQEADEHLSEDSQRVIAIAEDKDTGLLLIKKYIVQEKLNELSADDVMNLIGQNQTQGREENFMVTEVLVNELIS